MDDDEIDASAKRRRQETTMTYSMFLVFGMHHGITGNTG
jgi:hypothetical protein